MLLDLIFQWELAFVFFSMVGMGIMLEWHMRRRKWEGYDWARQIAFYNNFLYGIVNFLMTLIFPWVYYRESQLDGVSSIGDFLTLGAEGHGSRMVRLMSLLYLYSKLWEFQDIVWVYLSGIKPAITVQFWFHHLTTFPLTSMLFERGAVASFWMIYSNIVAHVFVYLFFAGLRTPVWSRCMMIMGTLQLLIGISSSSISLFFRIVLKTPFAVNDLKGELIALGIYSGYFVLWLRDLLQERQVRKIARQKSK